MLITRDDEYIKNFFENNKLDNKYLEEIKKCEYVFGVIEVKHNMSLKDKLSIGVTTIILDQQNIKYYYDNIKYIKKI